jgi:Uma2 family endonuclease
MHILDMLPTRQPIPIPAEAPRAPTQAEWDALSPAEQERVIDYLVCTESQEELDQADAMAETEEHYDAKEEVRNTLRMHFDRSGKKIYVGAERKVLYPGRKGFAPDIIAVVDVSPHKRDCWMVSREGRGIDVIIEVHYKGDWKKDFVDNVKTYADLGVPEYFIFDLGRQSLTAYRLSPGSTEYAPIARRAGRYPSEKLGLSLAVRRGRLRFYQGGLLLPSSQEVIADLEDVAEQEQARAENEQARAENEQARAEQEQARAEQFLLLLRENLLSLLSARGLSPGEVQLAEVERCTDPQQLRLWFDRALRASEVAAVFNDS